MNLYAVLLKSLKGSLLGLCIKHSLRVSSADDDKYKAESLSKLLADIIEFMQVP